MTAATIALLTDFGVKDYFVGAMKGAILTINPNAAIVDITHEIAPQDVRAAAFTLGACYRDFPKKTVFVAVVDPGVGSARRGVLLQTDEYFFVAPDNGLLSFVIAEEKDFRIFVLTNKKYFAGAVSRTFHGRDIFAPAAAHLSAGAAASEFGREIEDFARFDVPRPRRISAGEIEAEILHADRFGNLITNLKAADLPPEFRLKIGETFIAKHKKFYAEAETKEIFSILGSAGFLEIVAFADSARDLLKARVGQKISLVENS